MLCFIETRFASVKVQEANSPVPVMRLNLLHTSYKIHADPETKAPYASSRGTLKICITNTTMNTASKAYECYTNNTLTQVVFAGGSVLQCASREPSITSYYTHHLTVS